MTEPELDMKAQCVKCGDIPDSEVEMYNNQLNSFRHTGCGANVTFEYVHIREEREFEEDDDD